MPMSPEILTDFMRAAASREQQRQADAIIETQIKILTVTYDKAVAYTNLIVLAAYAGFFGLWQITKEYIPKNLALWSALLILISVVTFVAFEIITMVYVHHNVQTTVAALKDPEVRKNPQSVNNALIEISLVHERVTFHLMRVWAMALVLTISTGMAGSGLLAYAFIIGLAK